VRTDVIDSYERHTNRDQGVRELTFGETYINRENFEAMQGLHAGARKSDIGGADRYLLHAELADPHALGNSPDH